MSAEQLPDGLQLAATLLEMGNLEYAYRVGMTDYRCIAVAPAIAGEYLTAIDAIRAEHAQRLTLQHHAADQAQRIADLERHAANLVSESEAKIPAMQAAFEERLTLDRANRLLVARIADLETKCVTLKRLHDAAADERDALAQQHRSQHDADSAELRQLCADRDAARKERNALRARLAEIEAQEPVAFTLQFAGSQRINTETTYRTQRLADEYADGCAECGSDARPIVTPLYARPVPAQAVPESVDGLVSVFCYDEVLTFTFCDEAAADKFAGRFNPSVDSAAAPEHKA